jgi:gamma-glutamyltranspeptidase/glutathione hydrolase
MVRIQVVIAILALACPCAGEDYKQAAVASDNALASGAGFQMLQRGGNAVDAAVATSFCLSVVRPASCGIGGGGFMMIAGAGEPVVINYRETAPAAVGPNYYVDLDDQEASRYGAHAVGIPGTVAGLLYALEHYGTLDRVTVLAPAIAAAEHGFAADAGLVKDARKLADWLDANPERRPAIQQTWIKRCRAGELAEGDIVRNPAQAKALRLIAEHGADGFYRGELAQAIVAAVERGGGALTMKDLAGYRPRVGAPLKTTFGSYEVLSMPPPSSGGVAMQQMFGLLERKLKAASFTDPTDPAYVHLMVESMKHAFADRATWLADAQFVDVPIDDLLAESYLDELLARIDDTTHDPLHYGSVQPAPADAGTSHISVLDADGLAVACTETINLSFGSGVEVPEFGFVLNDEMDDFTTRPGKPNAFGLRQSDRNLPEPGKRPLSSMSPTVVLRDGRPAIIAGASGGPRIITATFQVIVNVLLFQMPAVDAVAAPRFHHQWMPDAIRFETGFSVGTLKDLDERGHATDPIEQIGVVQMIVVIDEKIEAVSDPRRGGRPAGR